MPLRQEKPPQQLDPHARVSATKAGIQPRRRACFSDARSALRLAGMTARWTDAANAAKKAQTRENVLLALAAARMVNYTSS
jgi:hypothetical protein